MEDASRRAAAAAAGDAARYHLFATEQEVRKARATGAAQAAAVAQLRALQLTAALDGAVATAAAAAAAGTHHHHLDACAPLRADALRLELAALVLHDAATGRGLAVAVGAAADQADEADAAARAAAATGAADPPKPTPRRRRAQLAQALVAAVQPADDDDNHHDDLRDALASGARAWELSAKLEAAAAAWERAQHERRRQEQQEQRRRQQQQQQRQQQQAPPPTTRPPAPGHPHELAARWAGNGGAAKRPRADREGGEGGGDDPIELGGASSDDDDAGGGEEEEAEGDGGDEDWMPGVVRGGRAAGGRHQQQPAAGRRQGRACGLPGPFATAAAAAAVAAAAAAVAAAPTPAAAAAALPPQPPPPTTITATAAAANNNPFQTARLQLVSDLRKKGQHQQAAALQAPRAGLTRPGGGGGRNGNGGASGNGAQGFVPPFMSKAIESVCNGGGAGGTGGTGSGGRQQGGNGQNQNQNANNNNAEPEGPLSPRTLELLRVPSAADLPPDLGRHEPRLLELVCSEVVDPPGNAGVRWDDIAGLATVKALVKEIVVWPMLNPSIFKGARAPPRGLLLFGPPGTGKTLIGRAIASQTGAAFFSISASSLTSKWIGEGEKLVRALFAVAAHLQPSVIFVDEVDSLLSARKAEGEHEASRRLKTELLVQMEGCDPSSSAKRARVLLVGATNRPEELDEAARRRMPKQLYIPLPCAEARRQMLARQLGAGNQSQVATALNDADYDRIVERTEGYSGSDMRALIQEACQGPVRDAVAAHGERVAELSAGDLRPVVRRDFATAAKAARASVSAEEVARYVAYDEKHGCKYVAGGGGDGGDGGDGAGGEEEEDDW
jgi:AAA+ superfamily predicted ATPase